MKRFHFRLRAMLLTLTLRLASVPFFNYLSESCSEVPVNLPIIEAETPINVFLPKKIKKKPEPCMAEDEKGYCYCSPHSMGIPGGCAKINESLLSEFVANEDVDIDFSAFEKAFSSSKHMKKKH